MSHIRTKTIGEACFWLGLVIEILIVIVDKSAYTNPLESQLFRLTFLLFCIKIALTKYSAGEWLCMLLFGAVMFVSYRINERDEAVRIIAFIAACKGMDIKKVMRVVCWVTFAGCAALVLLSVTGIYGKVAVTANFGREVQPGQFEETRYVLNTISAMPALSSAPSKVLPSVTIKSSPWWPSSSGNWVGERTTFSSAQRTMSLPS